MAKSSFMEKIIKELVESGIKSREDLDYFKRQMSKKYKIQCPKNVDLLKTYHRLYKEKSDLNFLLRKRPVRSLSGIVNVSVLTKPFHCSGKCIFCPNEKGVPKSYLKKEPAVQRAILNDFDPKRQVQTRLKSLKLTGHPIDKIELRIIGGTWSQYEKAYQTWFIKQCFLACNKGSSLTQLQKNNEKAKARIIGITIETRPDYINKEEIKRLRMLSVTRVELGVQSIYNDVLKVTKRGHTIEQTILATKLLKDAGFKVSYQIMPNLPNSSKKMDIEMTKEIFTNDDFKPDSMKIYPVALIKNTPLYNLYKKGKFKPYNKEQLIEVLSGMKKHIPFYCRVERIIRDIPKEYIVEGGSRVSNLRESLNVNCKCIRCREVKGFNEKEKIYFYKEEVIPKKEFYLSFENKERTRLYAFLRLKITDSQQPTLKGSSIIRELHTYGQMVEIGKKGSFQHKGLGKKLMQKAEKITKDFGIKKITVISGVGVRGYYRKLGYKLKDTYMVKERVK